MCHKEHHANDNLLMRLGRSSADFVNEEVVKMKDSYASKAPFRFVGGFYPPLLVKPSVGASAFRKPQMMP